jgi:parvulin-like peptidyl-prolyl isomerase
VSEVTELAGSYYLLYVEAKKNGTTKPLTEVHDDIENKLQQEQRQKAQEKWIETLRQKAFIKVY